LASPPERTASPIGASDSISTMSIALYGQLCAHAVQPVQVDSLIITSRRSVS
jgi:hypothetical protein